MRRKEQLNHAPRQPPYSVLIVDDDELIRRGIAAVISDESDFSVCGLAANEAGAVRLLERHKPDLLLLDLSLGHRDSMQFLKDISGRFAETKIIILSDEQHGGYGERGLEIGAAGYLAKSASAVHLIATMRAVAAGPGYAQSRRRSLPTAKKRAGSVIGLTDRELHVFRLIAAGLGTSRIAQELRISRKTVETHREHIKLKLGYSNAEALRKGALEWAYHSPIGWLNLHKNRGNP